jgi:hypothetical protein
MAHAQAVQVDSAIGAYQKASGVSGKHQQRRLRHDEQHDGARAETFRKLYPNVKIQIEGKGSARRRRR